MKATNGEEHMYEKKNVQYKFVKLMRLYCREREACVSS